MVFLGLLAEGATSKVHRFSFTLPQSVSLAISALWGPWHFWPSGQETPILRQLALITPCPRWSLADCVSRPAQIGSRWWVVPLVCRHPKGNCPRQRRDPSFFSKEWGLQSPLWLSADTSEASILHSTAAYTGFTIFHTHAPQRAA